MAKWKRCGGWRRRRGLSIYHYVETDEGKVERVLWARPVADMNAADAGAVLLAVGAKAHTEAVEEPAGDGCA